MTYPRLILVICALMLVVGQILFKKISLNYNKTQDIFHNDVLGLFVIACIIYGGTTILWVWALRYIELSKAYPFVAIGFIMVPLLSWYLFKEPLNLYYAFGIIFIIIGIFLTNLGISQ